MNLTEVIIRRLREAGAEAFMPGIHEGICTSPYCVVRLFSGTLSTPAGGYVRYRVHLYTPAGRPELLDALAGSVRTALLPMEADGTLHLAEPRGIVSIDDSYRAVCSYIDYVSYYSEMKGRTT